MDFNVEERIGGPPNREDATGSLLMRLSLLCSVFFIFAIVFLPELRSFLLSKSYSIADALGLQTPISRYRPVYARLGIAPLPNELAMSDQINAGLEKLSIEQCDNQGIFAFGEGLVQAGRKRLAADAYTGFLKLCPNGDGDGMRAAVLYSDIADYSHSIALLTKFIPKYPGNETLRYQRGFAYLKLGRFDEALIDYANTIALSHNPTALGEWVFLEMASAYASLNRFCEAASQIQTYVSIDFVNRDTSRMRKLTSDYLDQGGCRSTYAIGADKFQRAPGSVIRVNATVDGIPGDFVVDTGASFVDLTAQFARRASVKVSGQSVSLITANGVSETSLGVAHNVSVGRVEAGEVPVVIQDRSLGSGIDGLLGMSFLSRFELTVGPQEWALRSKAN